MKVWVLGGSLWVLASRHDWILLGSSLSAPPPLDSNNQEDLPFKKNNNLEDDLLHLLAWHAEDYKSGYSENNNKNWGCSSIGRAL